MDLGVTRVLRKINERNQTDPASIVFTGIDGGSLELSISKPVSDGVVHTFFALDAKEIDELRDFLNQIIEDRLVVG